MSELEPLSSTGRSSTANGIRSTPKKNMDVALRKCSTCRVAKSKACYPKRQWEKKNRRCFSCFTNKNSDFSYEPLKNSEIQVDTNNTIVENQQPNSTETVESLPCDTANNNSTPPSESSDDEIENAANSGSPPITFEEIETAEVQHFDIAPRRDGSNCRRCSCRDILFLFASPVLDETGSVKSIAAGMFTLFVVGSLIGVTSNKNPSLPTAWYQYVSAMIGYIYFICWSISFYPQVISNYKRKSTHGLSADFCTLNVIGFACYTTYNTSMFWSEEIREMYRSKYGSEPTVQSNDVAFAIHALLLSSITLGQIIYYRGSERPSKIILAVIVMVFLFCSGYPVLVLYKMHSWLDYIYALSFVKIGISLIKYIPQVILNFRRKSTVGWSIWNILLDFTGGILSDTQLVLDCVDMNDFSGITGNLAKFGLGFVSIFFDIIFLVQHYILFPDTRPEGPESGRAETEPLLSASERQGENSQDVV